MTSRKRGHMKKHLLTLSLIVIFSIVLASCTPAVVTQAPPPPAAPPAATVDVEALTKDIVGTVMSEMAKIPTATALPTATQQPTNTSAPTNTAAPAATATVAAPAGPYKPKPTATYYVDSCQVVSSTPDGIVVAPRWDFDGKFTIKNTGARDWNTSFYFKPLKSTIVTNMVNYMLKGPVAKGDEVSLTVDMLAPETPGIYTSEWGLVNDDAVVFCHFYVSIQVK